MRTPCRRVKTNGRSHLVGITTIPFVYAPEDFEVTMREFFVPFELQVSKERPSSAAPLKAGPALS